MPDEQLKPCPFCGAKAILRGGPWSQEPYSVWCSGEYGNRHHVKGTMSEAETIAKWNTRAAPNVKSLVWKSGQALTSTGNYIVIQEDWDEEPFWFVLRNGKPDGRLGEHSTEEEAKAAAQADYERRILGALE